jgi:hypothetical protein
MTSYFTDDYKKAYILDTVTEGKLIIIKGMSAVTYDNLEDDVVRLVSTLDLVK